MILRDMIDTLRIKPTRVQLRDSNNYELLNCESLSKAITPYLDCEVLEWFPDTLPSNNCMFAVLLKDESEVTE